MKKLLAPGLALLFLVSFLWAEEEEFTGVPAAVTGEETGPGVMPPMGTLEDGGAAVNPAPAPAPPPEPDLEAYTRFPPKKGFKPRVFEWGIVNIHAGVANSLLTWSDVFNSAKTLNFDLGKLPKDVPLGFGFTGEVQTWFKLRLTNQYEPEFILTIGVDADGYAEFSKDLTDMISSGLPTSFTGTGDSGMSVFSTVEFKSAFTLKKWRIFAAPEVYIPLLYMTNPDIHLTVDVEDPFQGELILRGDIYSPFNLKNFKDSGDVSGLEKSLGLNISLGAEYPLFDFLDVGAALYHIPLVPATLHNKASFNLGYDINPPDENGNRRSFIDILGDDFSDFFKEKPGYSTDMIYSDADYQVLRPFRANFYGVYKPFRSDALSFRGDIGFSLLTVYGPCFNMELSAKTQWRNFIGFEIGTGYREKVWRHKALLTLNMHVLELDLGAGIGSQSFLKSFLIAGVEATVGLRVGY